MKTTLLFALSAIIGAGAILWTGTAFIGTQPLGLAVTAVIGVAFSLGLLELVQYRRETHRLVRAVATAGDDTELHGWLANLPAALQQPVAQRIQGEKVGLPAPVMTPYLVGLLVLLGLLGTFIGMVDTLRGAVLALQGSTELAAIRQGLAAPMQGLSMAFGTSVAGIAASAMLGLNATLSRRERVLATRSLDRQVAGPWQKHSLAYHRRQTYQTLQEQAGTLPQLVARLDATASALEQMGERLSSQLQHQQSAFLDSSGEQLAAFADAVGRNLQESLATSVRAAADALAPVAERTLASLETQASGVQQQLLQANETHLRTTTEEMKATTAQLAEQLAASSGAMLRGHGENSALLVQEIDRLIASTETLVEQRAANEARWLDEQGRRQEAMTGRISDHLAALQETAASQLSVLGEAVGQQLESLSAQSKQHLASLESTAAEHLAQLGRELEAPLRGVIETAAETPRAAAEVIGTLRQELSNSLERDNALLEERQRIMAELSGLTLSLRDAASAQQGAVEELVKTSTQRLADTCTRFDETLTSEVRQLSRITADAAGSSAEIASLGDAFGHGVELYSESNQALMTALTRIEGALDGATRRSDEQMGYYVAQAREIIDQSMLSQREIIEELRRLGATGDLLAAEAG